MPSSILAGQVSLYRWEALLLLARATLESGGELDGEFDIVK